MVKSKSTPIRSSHAVGKEQMLQTPVVRRAESPAPGSSRHTGKRPNSRKGLDIGPDNDIDGEDVFTQPSRFRPLPMTPKTPGAGSNGTTITSSLSQLSNKLKRTNNKLEFSQLDFARQESPTTEKCGYPVTPKNVTPKRARVGDEGSTAVVKVTPSRERSPPPRQNLSYKVKNGFSDIVQTLTLELEQDLSDITHKVLPRLYKVISISRWNRFAVILELDNHPTSSRVVLVDHTRSRVEKLISQNPSSIRLGEAYVDKPVLTYFSWATGDKV